MTNWNVYRMFLMFITTIVFTRIVVGFFALTGRMTPPHIGSIEFHHFYLGLALFLVSYFIVRKSHTFAALFNGAAWGFVVDEISLPLAFMGYSNFTYWYFGSILITLIVVVIVTAGVLYQGS